MSVLLVGASGFFGTLISRMLANPTICSITRDSIEKSSNIKPGKLEKLIFAARNESKCKQLAEVLSKKSDVFIDTCIFNSSFSENKMIEEIKKSNVNLLINIAGPYPTDENGLKHTLARACIKSNVHYLDLADSNIFVKSIENLDNLAKENNVCVFSGCSTLPTISDSIINKIKSDLNISNEMIKSIEIGITPGWKTPRGLGTTKSILSTAGKPVKVLENGKWITRTGWGDSHTHLFKQPLGNRWLANINTPDYDIFSSTYPKCEKIRVYAGLELPIFHLGTDLLSKTFGKFINLGSYPYAEFLHKTTEFCEFLGTNDGGMYIRLLTHDGNECNWNLVAANEPNTGLEKIDLKYSHFNGATQMKGPRIPCIPSVVMVHKLLSDKNIISSGARACVNEVKYEEVKPLLDLFSIESSFDYCIK